MARTRLAADPPSARSLGLAVLGIALVGVVLRVAMGFESFWLDEAWSWTMAQQAGSAGEVLSGFKHDNNHPLNTLYLYAVRDAVGGAHWIVLRIPSLLAGCLSLFALAWLARAWGRVETLVVVLLAATSFPMIAASAQARGYAMAILLSLVYVAVARVEEPRGELRRAALLLGVAVLGLLSHPTFFYPLAGAAALTATRSLQRGEPLARAAGRVLLLHAAPFAAAALLFVHFYSQAEVGGGALYDRWVTVRQAVAQTMALPRRGPLTWLAAVVAVALSVQGLRSLWSRGEKDMACFFVVTLAVAPTVVIVVSDPQLIYARYLLTTFPWFYLLAAAGLAVLWQRGWPGRALTIAVVGFFAVSNGLHTGQVLAVGRDDYLETLRYIDQRTVAERIEIGSDHDFRNATLLRFYAERIPSRRPVVYVASERWPREGPEWYLRHDWRAGHDPEAIYEPVPGLRYERVQSFEHGPGDGFQWFVYHRIR